MSYLDFGKENVAEFLQSAIIIDDHFDWGPNGNFIELSSLEAPSESGEFDDNTVAESASIPLDGKINANSTIKGFSEKGIVCCPYMWSEEETELPKSVFKSDLVIFDWKLKGDPEESGDLVCKFISKILQIDKSNISRLRYISIYSSEPFDDICRQIAIKFDSSQGYSVTRGDGNFLDVKISGTDHSARIQYISKSGTSDEQLAEKLVEEFSKFLEGFFPNVVISAISEIRNRSFEYLIRFHQGLDTAVLSHFIALKSQKDAFPNSIEQFRNYLSSLIGSSIQDSLTYSSKIKNATSFVRVKEFISLKNDMEIGLNETKKTADSQIIMNILEKESHTEFNEASIQGLGISGALKKKFKNGKAPLVFSPDNILSKLELASLDLQKNNYKKDGTSPILRLGTIVKLVDAYYICTQPLCEGVRLSTSDYHSFSFIKLKEVIDLNSGFFYVIKDGQDYKKFINQTKQAHMERFKFKPDQNSNDIRAKCCAEKIVFISEQQQEFHWLGELKDVYSQELLHRLAHSASRVGSDKYEWTRLQQP